MKAMDFQVGGEGICRGGDEAFVVMDDAAVFCGAINLESPVGIIDEKDVIASWRAEPLFPER
jgi:hypothetical protein